MGSLAIVESMPKTVGTGNGKRKMKRKPAKPHKFAMLGETYSYGDNCRFSHCRVAREAATEVSASACFVM